MGRQCDDDLRIHLPSEEKAALRKLAVQEGRTLSAYARRVLKEHLAKKQVLA